MKLNLLPTHVSKEAATRSAWIVAVIIFVVFLVGSIGLINKGNRDYNDSREGIDQLEAAAKTAKDTGDAADTVIAQSTTLLRNASLAQAMIDHNGTYPALYDEVKKYIPSFYRVNSMSAQSNGAGQATVTLVGVLQTDQQYADLMLALLRWNKVTSISRGGFVPTNMYVPALTPDDQIGKPIHPGDAPIPDDPYKRQDYYLAKGGVTGYLGQNNYGTGEQGSVGPKPGASEVTVTMVIKDNLQTPDPRATLAAGGAAAPAGGGGGPAGAGGNLPTTPTSAPAPPSASSGSDQGSVSRIGRGRRGASEDDSSD